MPQSDFLDHILTRRSVRGFKPGPISVELLQQLLRVAPYGTAHDEREGSQAHAGR